MKIIVTTSDRYHHILPVFFRLFNREWKVPFELVGYSKPSIPLPENCTWVSLGRQRGPEYFTDDLKPYFEQKPDWFVWLFEDSFIKSVDHKQLEWLYSLCTPEVGRICLSREGMNRPHVRNDETGLWEALPDTNYRLSTQPSIWNKEFLLHYMNPGLSPWRFEKQDARDHWKIIGPNSSVVKHNEGVTRKDIHKFDLNGITL